VAGQTRYPSSVFQDAAGQLPLQSEKGALNQDQAVDPLRSDSYELLLAVQETLNDNGEALPLDTRTYLVA
jgi:hypothetical protein